MSSRARAALAFVLILAAVWTASGKGAAPRFYPDDPLWTDRDDAFDASGAKLAELSEGYDFLEQTFIGRGDRTPRRAMNVNTLGEVPDSSWFVNRIGRRPISLEEIRRGPDLDAYRSFDVTDWVITGSKGAAGFQPGFRAYDARDGRAQPQVFQLEGDLEKFPELATGAEMIGTMLYHALGYHVVDTYIVNVDPARLRISPDATIRDASGRRPFTQGDLDAVLRLLARNPDGTYRMTASRFVEGAPLEGFKYFGTRPDDPNDIYPHEHRRELRANRVFAAWMNHDDSRGINSLDMLVPVDGRSFIKHYMFDFGSILGSSPDRRWSGVEYLYEGRPTLLGLLSFGFWIQPWQLIPYPKDLPASVGRIQGDVFEPAAWKPEYPNPAFDNMDEHDAFWGARLVARFSDEAIAAAVDRAEYSDPRAAAYITSVLVKRRDAITRRWLTGVNPIVDVALGADGALTFENAAVQAGAATAPAAYALTWSRFDNATDAHQPVGGEVTLAGPNGRLPAELSGAEYVAVTIRTRHPDYPAWNQPIRAYFRRSGAGWVTVGLERL